MFNKKSSFLRFANLHIMQNHSSILDFGSFNPPPLIIGPSAVLTPPPHPLTLPNPSFDALMGSKELGSLIITESFSHVLAF